jgi:hypothetical protein
VKLFISDEEVQLNIISDELRTHAKELYIWSDDDNVSNFTSKLDEYLNDFELKDETYAGVALNESKYICKLFITTSLCV